MFWKFSAFSFVKLEVDSVRKDNRINNNKELTGHGSSLVNYAFSSMIQDGRSLEKERSQIEEETTAMTTTTTTISTTSTPATATTPRVGV